MRSTVSATLTIADLDVAFGARTLFTGLDLTLGDGDVTAVVGPNGSGKSTLMRTIVGELPVEHGSVQLAPRHATIAWLPQVLPDPEESLLAYARRRTGVTDADRELERSTAAMASETHPDRMPLSADRYARALDRWLALGAADLDERLPEIASQVGLDVERVVSGVLEIVDAHMERALRAVSIEEGADPRDAVLVAFGGAGGLHATRLARRLGIGTVLVPPHSGVFSALGLLLATPRADAVRTVMLTGGDSRLGPALQTVAGEATDRFVSMFDRSPEDVVLGVDARYRGQSHELEVAVDQPDWAALTTSFHRAHLERFGFERPGEEVEIVNVRAVATGVAPITWDDLPSIPEEGSAVASDGVWKRGSLPAGFSVDGPAVVVEDNSATLLEQGDHLEVLSDGTLRIEVG